MYNRCSDPWHSLGTSIDVNVHTSSAKNPPRILLILHLQSLPGQELEHFNHMAFGRAASRLQYLHSVKSTT